MTNCAHKGCDRTAHHVPVVCVPAAGYARDTHKPIRMVVGIPLCAWHLKTFKIKDVPGISEVMVSLAGAGANVDPARAWLEKTQLDGAEYLSYLEHRESVQ